MHVITFTHGATATVKAGSSDGCTCHMSGVEAAAGQKLRLSHEGWGIKESMRVGARGPICSLSSAHNRQLWIRALCRHDNSTCGTRKWGDGGGEVRDGVHLLVLLLTDNHGKLSATPTDRSARLYKVWHSNEGIVWSESSTVNQFQILETSEV